MALRNPNNFTDRCPAHAAGWSWFMSANITRLLPKGSLTGQLNDASGYLPPSLWYAVHGLPLEELS